MAGQQATANFPAKAGSQVPRRREQIVRTFHDICLEKGYAHITIGDITRKIGITRSLFYHYFRNKEDVAAAVLDDATNTIIAKLDTWNGERETGNIDKALDDLVTLMRAIINDEGPFSKRMVQSGNGALYIQFVDQMSERVADYICSTTVKDFERIHSGLPVRHIKETLMILISGSVALLREQPQVDDATIKEIVAQTLHLEAYI
ncbi:AcrR family transcriptional regulator [Bifidobacterium actinocoloniiforme DSM 22766]|nr:AcrR family transcriptional regulator [Bifidobacterium actinocoloniiforme DSM 22766]